MSYLVRGIILMFDGRTCSPVMYLQRCWMTKRGKGRLGREWWWVVHIRGRENKLGEDGEV
ncbi:hypothetical protein HanPI659440_Chr16g0658661 [Helianthus annuus]|nr:hypothetical protein HanPI659440_Chr16g0658661 [Helianthus annuus]